MSMENLIIKEGYQIHKVLSGRTNSYLIIKNNQSVLVDTGKASAYNRLVKNIEKLLSGENTLEYLILTHTHFDHCQSAYRIKNDYGCKIVVSEKAVNSIEAGYTKLPEGTGFITGLISKAGERIGKKRFGYHVFQPDILIDMNNTFQIGSFEIKIIPVAGHSEDSISIIINNEVAIVGDSMFGIFRNSIFPPFADNIKKMIESWGKLLNTHCGLFLPGHGKAVERKLLEKEYKKYVRKYNL